MQKKVLVISDCPTHPTDAGNRSCQLAYCELLKNLGYKVFFLYIIAENNDPALPAMERYWGKGFSFYKTPFFQTFLQRAVSKVSRTLSINFFSLDIFCPWFISRFVARLIRENAIDSVIVNYVWLSKILKQTEVKNKLIFTHDVFTHKRLKGNSQWFSFSPNVESKALMRCKKILAIQENEAVYYQYLSPNSKVYTVYNPYNFHKQEIKGKLDLLFFSGGNEHNVNGIRHFLDEIFPQIKKTYPQIKLLLGGGICRAIASDRFDESVELKGFFDNPDDFYQLGDIVINPVYEGTGLKIKSFEAISYGKVVLAHPHSFEGVYKKEIAPMWCCKDANDYVRRLDEIQNGTISIREVKNRCEEYIDSLNEEIKDQYQKALY